MDGQHGVEHQGYVASDRDDSDDDLYDHCEGLADALDYISISDGETRLCPPMHCVVFPHHVSFLWSYRS